MEEASATTQSKLDGSGSTKTGGTGSILIAGILNEREDTGAVNNISHNNDETVQVADVIEIYSESDGGSNCDMEDSDFMVEDEEIPNFYEEEDERNFMINDWKWGS